MPRLKWLMFQVPMSSPQRIRIFGCFVAMIYSFLFSDFALRLPAVAEKMHRRYNVLLAVGGTQWTPPEFCLLGRSAYAAMFRPSCDSIVAGFIPLKGVCGS